MGAKGHRFPSSPFISRFTLRLGLRLLARQCSYFSHHTLRCWETVKKKKKINQPCDLLHKPKAASVHGSSLTGSFLVSALSPLLQSARSLGESGKNMTEPNTSVCYGSVLLLTRSGVTWNFLTHVSDPVYLWSLSFSKTKADAGAKQGISEESHLRQRRCHRHC